MGNPEKDVYLSVIIPAYNEEKNIYNNLLIVLDTIETITPSFELVVVNDGSKDNTFEEIERASKVDNRIIPVQSIENTGKGGALKIGTAKANGKYIGFLDADLDLSPAHLVQFMKIMQETGADAVIGSKMHKDSKLNYPKSRRMISRIYYSILYMLFRLRVHDTQTGVKLFKADYIKPTMQKILVKRFAFDIEVLSIGAHQNKKIVEAPIELNFTREQSWGRITFKDLMQTGLDTLAVFYRLHILHYYDN